MGFMFDEFHFLPSKSIFFVIIVEIIIVCLGKQQKKDIFFIAVPLSKGGGGKGLNNFFSEGNFRLPLSSRGGVIEALMALP